MPRPAPIQSKRNEREVVLGSGRVVFFLPCNCNCKVDLDCTIILSSRIDIDIISADKLWHTCIFWKNRSHS